MRLDDLGTANQVVPKSDRFKAVQSSSLQREAPLRPPVDQWSWADLPEFEKRKTVRDVAFSTLPLIDASFSYLRAGEESRQRGEGFWPGVFGETPQSRRQRRAIQSFYEGAQEELPDWVKVLRQTGVPGGPFMKAFKAISAVKHPIASGASIGGQLAGESAYLQSQARTPQERLQEAIAAVPQGAAFGGAFGLPGHIVPHFLPQRLAQTQEAPPPTYPRPEALDQTSIREALANINRGEPRGPITDADLAQLRAGMSQAQQQYPGSTLPQAGRAQRQEDFNASRSALVRALSSEPFSPDINAGGNFPIRTSTAIERGLSGEHPGIRQRVRDFKGGPVAPIENELRSRFAPGYARAEQAPAAPASPESEVSLQRPGVGTPSYMLSRDELSATFRTPEEIKEDLRNPTAWRERTQYRLDANQEQPYTSSGDPWEDRYQLFRREGVPLQDIPPMLKELFNRENRGGTSLVNEPHPFGTLEEFKASEREREAGQTLNEAPRRAAEYRRTFKPNMTERFPTPASGLRPQTVRDQRQQRFPNLMQGGYQGKHDVKAGRPAQYNWRDVAKNWAGVDWDKLNNLDQQDLREAYRRFLDPNLPNAPQKQPGYKWSSGLSEVRLGKPQTRRQEQEQGPISPPKVPGTTKGMSDLEIAQRQGQQTYVTSYEKEAINKSLNTVNSSNDLDYIVARLFRDKSLSEPERYYYGVLQDYLNRHRVETEPRRHTIIKSYYNLTGNEPGKGVKIKDFFNEYRRVVRTIPEDQRASKGLGTSRKGAPRESGFAFYEKGEQALRNHLYTYGRRTTESFDEVPTRAAPWVIDEATDTVYLNPHLPNKDGVQRAAQQMGLEGGLNVLQKNRLEPLVPEVPKGRVAQQAQQPQPPGGKPPARRKLTEPIGPPKEPDEIKGPKRKTVPMGRRIEGETAMSAQDFGSTLRAKASGLPVGNPVKRQYPKFVNPELRTGLWVEIEKIFSPTAVSRKAGPGEKLEPSRAAEQIIRSIEGTGRRQIAQGSAAMEPYVKAVYDLPKAAQLDLVHYIQTGGQEGHLASLRKTHPRETKQFDKLANALANLYKGYEAEIKTLDRSEQQNFMQNYLPQIWKEKTDFRAKAHTFLKERKLPTYKAAMEKGFTPVTENPIEMTMMYMSAMRKYLDIRHAHQEGLNTGYVKALPYKAAPPANTRLLEYTGRGGKKYYANEDYARVFNNYVSKGIYNSPELGNVYNGLLRMTNASTALQLGLSAFHASTMLKESYLAALSDGVKALSQGKPVTAAKRFATAPAAPVTLYLKGQKLMEAYLGQGFTDQKMEHLAQLASRANMRLGELDEVYRATAMGSYAKNIARGGLGWAARKGAQEFVKDASQRPVTASLQLGGKLIETVAHPLFYHYIPRLKAGVFMDRMSTWLSDNPHADMAGQVREAQRIADVIDDQFGELVQNNLFWDATLKQTSNLFLTSTGWTLGTLRLFGQGATDVARGVGKTVTTGRAQPLTDRAAYLIATVIGVATLNALYQALKTGEAPKEAQDLATPRTGGKTIQGDPERALIPGYEKDIMGWWHDPAGELYNKMGPLPKVAYEEFTNKDWRGDPIRNASDDFLTQTLQAAGHALSLGKPISLSSAFNPASPETGVSGGERFMGIRSAGSWISSPETVRARESRAAQRAWKRKMKHEAQDEARRGFPLESLGTQTQPRRNGGFRLEDLGR